MDEHSNGHEGMSEQHPKVSPWPVFVALGLVLSEVGVVFNAISVAVGGILLFAVSVVGIVRESGYALTLWRPTAVVGSLFAAAGAALFAGAALPFRATYVGATGGALLVAAAALFLHESGRL